MALELNLTKEDKRDEGFKEYSGRNIEQRPLIVAAGRIPMRAAHMMAMRILHPQSAWMSNYYDCDDRIAYHSSGARFKISSRGTLKDYREYGMLANSSVEFDDVRYEELPWPEFRNNKLIHERALSRKEAYAHAGWSELSQRNKKLLEAFADILFRAGNYRAAMGMYLDSGTREKALMGALGVYWLDVVAGSWAGGVAGLDSDDGRLVGVAPEALVHLERRLRDERRIRVDFVGALGNEAYRNMGATRAPVEVKSASGFQPLREYDVEIGEAHDEKYVPETHLASVLSEIESAGKIDSNTRELILRRAKEQKETA